MNFIKSHKKISALVVVLLVAAVIGTYVFTNTTTSTTEDTASSLEEARTVTIAKGSLKSTVNVSGKVISAVQSDVTTETTTAKVTSLNVKVGDKVKKGDVICQLDTSDIDAQIKSAKKAISDAEAANAKTISAAQRTLSRAQTALQTTTEEQNTLVKNAQDAVDKAQQDLDALDKKHAAEVNSYVSQVKIKYSDFLTKHSEIKLDDIKTIADAVSLSQSMVEFAQGDYLSTSTDAVVACEAGASTKCETSQDEYAKASTIKTSTENELNVLKSQLEYDKYSGCSSTVASAASTLSAAEATKTSAINTAQAAVQSAQDGLDDAQNVTSQDTSNLEKLQKQREDLTLKAETDGEITALNVKLGSLPSKSTVATIQSTSQLIFEVTIPENYINKVSKGLSVTVTADSIDEPVTGTLTMISSTAGDSGSSTDDSSSTSSTDSSKSSGYKAQITLTNAGQLHIGSSAKGSILLAETDNVYVVPIDAVGTDEGLSFIRVKQKDGSYKKISVKTGNQNDTDIEVSGEDLEEGMEVLSNVDYEALVSEAQTESEQEAASASES